ncbi:hypothetical protein [Candidatus Vidania fulgoroideorum]
MINNILKKCLFYNYILVSNNKFLKNNYINSIKLLNKDVLIKSYKTKIFSKIFRIKKGNFFFFINDLEKFLQLNSSKIKKIPVYYLISFKKKLKKNIKEIFCYKNKAHIFLKIIHLFDNFLYNFVKLFCFYYESKKNI